jgi:hypothetical protein
VPAGVEDGGVGVEDLDPEVDVAFVEAGAGSGVPDPMVAWAFDAAVVDGGEGEVFRPLRHVAPVVTRTACSRDRRVLLPRSQRAQQFLVVVVLMRMRDVEVVELSGRDVV